MLTIDGSMGEGGGQVLRTSLALSLLTASPFRITQIRKGRARPGLMRQHLMSVRAATEVGGAEVTGAEMGSTELVFRPSTLRGGDYTFAIGGAGSTTLVFQTVLLPLLLGTTTSSTLRLSGGTHNPMAPPVDFLKRAFLPLLARMGAKVELAFERHGFYPAGGGSWAVTIHPAEKLGRLELLARGEITAREVTALVAQVKTNVALREIEVLTTGLGWDPAGCHPTVVKDSHGPGNVVFAAVASEHVTEVFTAFGERGTSAEAVAGKVVAEVRRYLAAGVPVGEHLADQLLLPMALGGGGSFTTVEPSPHCRTQMDLLKIFLGAEVVATEEGNDRWRVEVPRG